MRETLCVRESPIEGMHPAYVHMFMCLGQTIGVCVCVFV